MAANPMALNEAPVASGVENGSGDGHERAGGHQPGNFVLAGFGDVEGFFSPGGRAVPAVSFTKHASTSSSAGTQNNGLAYQLSRAFCSASGLEVLIRADRTHAHQRRMATPVIMDRCLAMFRWYIFVSRHGFFRASRKRAEAKARGRRGG